MFYIYRSTDYSINKTEDINDANLARAGAITLLNLPTTDHDNQVKFSTTDDFKLIGGTNHTIQSYSSTKLDINNKIVEQATGFQCKVAKDKLVFIKTHKTGSTTIATILERYGYRHNLTFAIPWVSHIFHKSKLFNRNMVMVFSDQNKFDMLTNHARFNRKEMEVVVPGAKFVTIIRDPITQFESAFGYYEMAKSLGLAKKQDPLAEFVDNPQKYFRKKFYLKEQSNNGQMYDLGLNHRFHDDTREVERHISTLEKELDLVMLTEYIDESLILLRKLMCWSLEDILYLSKGVRNKNHRNQMSPEIAEKIREWNAADLVLCHFNRTFWQKVSKYGPNFDRDLHFFRQLQKSMTNACLDTEKDGLNDYRETSYAKKRDAPDICDDLVRGDQEYVSLIRWREVRTEFGLLKLLAIIAGGIVLIVIKLTALLIIINKLVQRFCKRTKSIA